jgi:tetratricopeptide (TPR) repeat protein
VRGRFALRAGVVISDELLHDLLSKASSLYNSGEYRGAIQAWKEALKVDPSSRKAAEGIRMATLLLTEDDPLLEPSGPEQADVPAADGAVQGGSGPSPEQLEERLDQGIARVKELLSERKFQDAVEGARGLLPISPESETVQRLIEEAQHAYESAPFIEEQVTLTKELMAQERFDEAETMCKKVFILDPTNVEARSLMSLIRARKAPSGAAREAAGAAEDAARSEAPPDAGGDESPEFDLGMEELPSVEAAPPAEEPEVVEAKTKVPPTVRLVPRTPPQESSTPSKKPPASAPVSRPVELDPDLLPKRAAPAEDPMAWETELAQLNLKEEESDILRGGGDDAPAAPADAADAELMSLLDTDLSALTTEPSGAAAEASPSPVANEEAGPPKPAATKPTLTARTAAAEAREARNPSKSPAEPRGTSAVPKYFVLLGVVILALAAAGWWFFFQPRSAGGTGSPSAPAAPPGGAPSSGGVAAQGPIPTPMGGGSRQAAQPLRTGPDDPESQPPGGVRATSRPGAPHAASAGPSPEGVERELQGPPKPPPPLSPEEIHRKVAAGVAEGRRLMAQQKWKEACDILQAAVALDPLDFQVKEVFDQAQGKLDEETRLRQDFKQAAALFADKDYQNALWKLYRLPRERGLGDLDLYIRNAWFNWAVVALRAGDATDALQKLSETLTVDPEDAEAQKLQGFTQRYANRAKDRLYFGFVENLRFRNMEQR